MKFPKIVYRNPGKNRCSKECGGSYDWKAVKDEEGLRVALATGWRERLADAPPPGPAVASPVAPVAREPVQVGSRTYEIPQVLSMAQEASGLTSVQWNSLSEEERDGYLEDMIEALESAIPASRAELELKATQLGIDFPSNIKDSTLAAKIEDALVKKGELPA